MTIIRRATMLAAVLFALLVLAGPAFAQDVTPPDPTKLPSVVDYLATGGAAVVAAVVVSWLSARIPQFGALDGNVKWSAQVGLSALLGLGAYYLITYQPALITQLAPVFKVLVLAVAPAIGNQLWYAGQKLLTAKPAA